MTGFYASVGKRMLDSVLVILFAFFFSWLIVLIILVYALTLHWPVLYKSSRIGRDAQHFVMYKFRTLSGNDRLPLAQRRFWLGDVLRATNLDELPQLWNVLKGEMSLVGPRPLPAEYARLFTPEQNKRHGVLPGITGWAQVNGKNSLPWEKKFKYDLEYVTMHNFLMDIRILLKTVVLIFAMEKDVSLEEEKLKR